MSVYKRGAVYYMDFIFKGVRVHRTTDSQTKADALKIEKIERDAMRKEYLEGRLTKSPIAYPTLSQAASRVYDERWYRMSFGKQALNSILYVVNTFGNPQIHKVDKAYINKVKTGLKDKSVATQNRYLANIRTVLNMAKEEWDYELQIPRFKLAKEGKGREVVIDASLESTLQQYFTQKNNLDMPDLLAVLMDTGMRISEALKGSYGVHYNMEAKVIRMYARQTKGDTDRTIPMSDRVYAILEKRKDTHFPKPFPYTRFQVSDAFRTAKKALGIEDTDLCIHSTRHTFASRLLNGGADLRTVQVLLGHSSITTTARYAHLATPKLQEAIEKLG